MPNFSTVTMDTRHQKTIKRQLTNMENKCKLRIQLGAKISIKIEDKI